jgi:hypothetical protein
MRSELAKMRENLRAALPERAFIRRDRGEYLFISNAPVFDAEIETLPGFLVFPAGKLIAILPDSGAVSRIEAHFEAMDDLSASLQRFRGTEADPANIRLFSAGLKLLDTGESVPENEVRAFERNLRQRSALALRGGCSGGGLYACAILNHQIHKGE